MKFLLTLLMMYATNMLFAQENIILSGNVYSTQSRDSVEFATITVLEAGQKTYSDSNGNFTLTLPARNSYTVIIASDGYRRQQLVVRALTSTTLDVYLDSYLVKGSGITITDKRKIQDISRRTMRVDEMREVPGTLGDSLTALAKLPGISQFPDANEIGSLIGVGGILVMRGVDGRHNRYFVDGVPIPYSQHFQLLHSVISNEAIDEIDTYLSSYPTQYKASLGGVIDFRTVDSVDKSSLLITLDPLNIGTAFKTPVSFKKGGDSVLTQENSGYLIAAGKVGLIPLTIQGYHRLDYELSNLAGNEDEDYEPMSFALNFIDYQVKYKQYLSSQHSITLLAVGANDYSVMFRDKDEMKYEDDQNFYYLFNTFALALDSRFGNLSNRAQVYASLPEMCIDNGFDPYYPQANIFYNIERKISPHEYCINDTAVFNWLNKDTQFTASARYTLYGFKVKTKSKVLNEDYYFDLNELLSEYDYDIENEPIIDEYIVTDTIDKEFRNHSLYVSLDNSFVFGSFSVTPQCAFDYLYRTGFTEIDPRLCASYEFPTGTTLSIASGRYHSYSQVNPFAFQIDPSRALDGKEVEPEYGFHNTAGIRQELGDFSATAEGYYNYYWNLLTGKSYYHKERYIWAENSGKQICYGAELLLERLSQRRESDYFGWIGYNYAIAQIKEDGSSDWGKSPFQQKHKFNTVVGFVFGNHSFAVSFCYMSKASQLESSLFDPETRYTDGESASYIDEMYVYQEDDDVYYWGSSKGFYHRLDLRYNFVADYKWSKVKYYIEILDAYAPFYDSDDNIGMFIPLAGIEMRF